MKKITQFIHSQPWLFVLLLSLPVLFVNIKSSHSWGDDFALYIHQAKNITEGISPQNTGLIYNEENPIMISAAAPGFSLLLSPVYYFFANNIKAFSYFISFFLMLAAFSVLLFYKKRVEFLPAVLLLLFILYHRWTLNFKQNILTDIPFVFFTYLILALYDRWQNKIRWGSLLLLALLTGFTLTVRTFGLVLVFGIVADIIFRHIIKKDNRGDKRQMLTFVGKCIFFGIVSLLVYLAIQKLSFPQPIQGSYSEHLRQHNIGKVISENPAYYYSYFSGFFKLYHVGAFLSYFTLISVILLSITGFIHKVRINTEAPEWVFVFYLFILFIYPATPGFRYLFPLIPLFLLYVYEGAKLVAAWVNKEKSNQLAIGFLLVLTMQLYPGFYNILIHQKDEIKGPYSPPAQEVFEVIRTTTTNESRFVFRKPRALALFTGRQVMANNLKQRNAELMDSIYEAQNIDYLLMNSKELPDSALLVYLKVYSSEFDTAFTNDEYILFHKIDF